MSNTDYKCPRCSFTSKLKNNVKRHLYKRSPCHVDLLGPNKTEIINNALNICSWCYKMFGNDVLLKKHIDICGTKQIKKEMLHMQDIVNDMKNEVDNISNLVKKERDPTQINNLNTGIKLIPYDKIDVLISIFDVINFIQDVVNHNEYINDLSSYMFQLLYYNHEVEPNHVIYATQKNKEIRYYMYKQNMRFEYVKSDSFNKFLDENFNLECIGFMGRMLKHQEVIDQIPIDDLLEVRELFRVYVKDFEKNQTSYNKVIKNFMLENQYVVEKTYRKMLKDSSNDNVFKCFTKNQLKNIELS